MPAIELYPHTEIVFEDSKSHPLACSFLIRFIGWQPGLWQLIAGIEDKEKVGGWWRLWAEDFYKVVKVK